MAEKEYIGREKLPKRKEYWDDDFGAGWDACLDAIDSIPAADVRPVVLCRDCGYYQADCGWCGLFDIGMHVNDFCSRGKRREES